VTVAVLGVAWIPKSFTTALWPMVREKFVPAMVNTPVFPIFGGCGGVGPFCAGATALTVTVTVTATETVVVEPLVVTFDVGTVPKLQVALVVVLLQLPVTPPEDTEMLVMDELGVEFGIWLTLSVNTTPVTGSPVL
jgi:hypothetical protein